MGLPDNIWWTRKIRIQTEKRLLSNALQTQILLLWYSVCSVIAAIYYLKFNTESEIADVAWIGFSVLILGISGFINGLGYKDRAGLIKNCYEALNSLYRQAKEGQGNENDLANKYEKILNVCENHADIDYHLTLCDTYLSHNNPDDSTNGLNKKPTRYSWIRCGLYYIKKLLLLIILYLLPVALFLIMELGLVS